jgi:hypothetical protein
VVTGTYRELFAATAAAGGALTGLLFVAMSVAPHQGLVSGPPVIGQIRSAAALLTFTNSLAVSLFSLVPGTNAGYPAVVAGIIGIAFTAAAVRSIWTSQATRRQRDHQIELVLLLVLVFGTEVGAGIAALASPGHGLAVQLIGYAVVTALLVGIARAWELIGARNTGILTSLAVLTQHRPAADGSPAAGPPAESEGQQER